MRTFFWRVIGWTAAALLGLLVILLAVKTAGKMVVDISNTMLMINWDGVVNLGLLILMAVGVIRVIIWSVTPTRHNSRRRPR